MPLSLVTATPGTEPITVSEAKLQVKQIQSEEDSLVEIYIAAARERAELATGRALLIQTWDYLLDRFPSCGYIELPKPPLQSVTYLKYRDTDGTLTTWASTNYVTQAPAGPRCRRGRVALAYETTWPVTYGQMGDVTVRFVAGYTVATMPSLLKAAMLLDIGMLYADRENVIKGTIVAELPGGVGDIYWSYRSHQRQVAG